MPPVAVAAPGSNATHPMAGRRCNGSRHKVPADKIATRFPAGVEREHAASGKLVEGYDVADAKPGAAGSMRCRTQSGGRTASRGR